MTREGAFADGVGAALKDFDDVEYPHAVAVYE